MCRSGFSWASEGSEKSTNNKPKAAADKDFGRPKAITFSKIWRKDKEEASKAGDGTKVCNILGDRIYKGG